MRLCIGNYETKNKSFVFYFLVSYTYIYREREKERGREIEIEREKKMVKNYNIKLPRIFILSLLILSLYLLKDPQTI